MGKTKRVSFKAVKLLALDFDGVMTDNKVYVDDRGNETVRCSRSDGLGIERLTMKGIKVLVISKEKNKVVRTRCKKLGIACIQGVERKTTILRQRAKVLKIPLRKTCYVGNDINDMECMRAAGIGCAVCDAHPNVLRCADYITKRRGGAGAVREVCDLIVEGTKK